MITRLFDQTYLIFSGPSAKKGRMKTKVIILAIGVLGLLPSLAAAGEFEAHCEGAAVCKGTIQGTGMFQIREDNGLGLNCTAVTGSTTVSSTSATGSAQLQFEGCTLWPVAYACQSGG